MIKNKKIPLLITITFTSISLSKAITIVSATGGTYTINAYDFDSTTGTAILNTGNATSGTFRDGIGTSTFNLSGLDFNNYSYSITYDSFTATTGNAGGAGATFGTTHSIAQNGWATITGVYDTYTDGTTEALTAGEFDFSTDANAHVQELTFTIAATPIPEPTSAAFLSLGSCALLLRRKRS